MGGAPIPVSAGNGRPTLVPGVLRDCLAIRRVTRSDDEDALAAVTLDRSRFDPCTRPNARFVANPGMLPGTDGAPLAEDPGL